MVMITIDSKEYEAIPGETVLDVAKRNNVFIPTLCHHPSVEPYSACRLCVVGVTQKGWTKVTASCSLLIKEGMEIKTSSPRIDRSRKILMELYLARCPESSELKEVASKLGVDSSRFKTYTEPNEKCILCGLCVNVCEQVMGVGAIGFANRGAAREVIPPFQEHSDVCTTCGACAFVCPTQCIDLSEISTQTPEPLLSDYDAGLAERKAVHIPFPQAIPNVPIIDKDACMYALNGTCKSCENFCEPEAILYDQEDEDININIGSVILSPGADVYEPPEGDSLGYGLYPNVLTSLEFERMLSASGPFQGHIKRLSDGEEPKKIAWLQCIGSRDESCDHKYCSSVCCMYSIKEAVIAKEHLPGLDTHIYFMDMRTFGKDFERYYERAEDEYGVVFRRSRVPRIEQNRETGELSVRYINDNGDVEIESYDMVVLAVGMQPCDTLPDLASIVNVNLNGYGFIEVDPYYNVETSRSGIYASGSATEPKDIPESVIEASAAAAIAARDIKDARGSEVTTKEYPRERDVSNEFPRTGVFLCHCGINIGGIIDIQKVKEYVQRLPYVALADDETFSCSQDSLERIKERINELGLNRIVVASCTPRTHEPLFQDTLREAGLNPHLFEMVNLRDQNSWVHRDNPVLATEKAKETVAMGVVRVNEMRAVSHEKFPVVQKALVIGGGISGMSSAIALSDQGFDVYLIEREEELGGLSRDVHLGIGDEDPQKLLEEMISKTTEHENISLYTGAILEDIDGYVGNYTSRISHEGTTETIEHGAVVVATGGEAYEPTEYSYEDSENIITQKEFEKDLASGKKYLGDLKEVVMIQCVGSRNDEHPYCSRICCSNAIKNAVRLKENNPDVSVYVLYRDIRTYGFKEDSLYRKARGKGVFFIKFDENEEPQVDLKKGKITVQTKDKILQRDMILNPDKLVLSVGVVPGENTALAQQLKVPLNSDGFYSEAHMKLRPVEFSADGIFLCGLAHSPRFMDEAIAQARAASSRAATILSKEYLETGGSVANIASRRCAGCKLCVNICPYDALDYDEEKRIVIVNEILCQGCGACAAICPSGTAQQNSFTKRQIMSMIDECIR